MHKNERTCIHTLRAGAVEPPAIFNAVSEPILLVNAAGGWPLKAAAVDAKSAGMSNFLSILSVTRMPKKIRKIFLVTRKNHGTTLQRLCTRILSNDINNRSASDFEKNLQVEMIYYVFCLNDTIYLTIFTLCV